MEVEVGERESVIRWKVSWISSLQTYWDIPEFRSCGRRWMLGLNSNGTRWNSPYYYYLLTLELLDLDRPIGVRFSMGIRTAQGSTEVWETGTHAFDRDNVNVRRYLIERSELFRRKDELLPGDVMTIILTLGVQDGSSHTVFRNASVRATAETNVADSSVQTAVEDSGPGGGKSESSEKTESPRPTDIRDIMNKGTVEEVEIREKVFHWTVEEFSLWDDRVRSCYFSPTFHLGGRRWYLQLYPVAVRGNQSEGSVELSLFLECDESPIEVQYSAGIRTAEGLTEVWMAGLKTFDNRDIHKRRVWCRSIEKSELLRRRDDLLPRDVLTLALTLRVGEEVVSETVLKHASVQAAAERDVADVSIQTAVEDSAAGGRQSDPLGEIDVQKLREHFKLWLEHPEEGDRIRRLRIQELDKRWKCVEKQLRDDKEPIVFAA